MSLDGPSYVGVYNESALTDPSLVGRPVWIEGQGRVAFAGVQDGKFLFATQELAPEAVIVDFISRDALRFPGNGRIKLREKYASGPEHFLEKRVVRGEDPAQYFKIHRYITQAGLSSLYI